MNLARKLYNAGIGALNGTDEGTDKVYGVECLLQAAAYGSADAQCLLGQLYEKGDGLPQSDEESARWYMRAADAGHIDAQFYLAYCYKNGRGVEKDWNWFLYWLRQSVKGGECSCV